MVRVLTGFAVIGRSASMKIKKAELLASDILSLGGLVGAWVVSLRFVEGIHRRLSR